MAAHLRKQIREAVATAVTGLSTTGANVFQSRVYALERDELPGLRIYPGSETIVPTTIHSPMMQERTLQIRVEAIAQALVDLDDELDQIVKEVEIAIAGMSVAGIATSIALVDIQEPELTGEGEQPLGRTTLTFEVRYFTADNAPDVAL